MDPKDIVRKGYDKVSRAYRGDYSDLTDAVRTSYRQCTDLLLKRLTDGGRVLDLGCGCGIPATQVLSEHHRVTGADISPVQIERARSLVPDAEFVCADMTELTYPPETFDAVVSLYAIIHVPLEEQPALFQNIACWLKPEGWLLFNVGQKRWTGTEEDWLGVPGGTMFWSQADQKTYLTWLTDLRLRVVEKIFIPEGEGGFTGLLAQKQEHRESPTE